MSTLAFRKEMSAEMRKMISDLFLFLAQHQRGTTLYWEQLEAAAQCKRGQMLYDALRRARKRLLKQYSIATWVKRDVGLRLLTHV